MISFTSFSYIGFLLGVVVLYWGLRERRRQNIFLLVVSYIFYGSFGWKYLGLIAFSTLLAYFTALRMERAAGEKHRKALLYLSVAGNLAILGYFKYYNFFIENANDVFRTLGLHFHLRELQIWLPIGISFYTFQVIGYSVDVYRKEVHASKSLIDLALFVSFFAQLVAGPIERSKNLLCKVQNARTFSKPQFMEGVDLIFWGILKKLVVADNIGYFVNMIFALKTPSLGLLLMGGFGFGLQLFSDFSAYTDITRGSGKLLGFDIVKNFDMPFLARTPMDFWNRWHISLTTWVKDYVYFPLSFAVRKWPLGWAYSFSVMIAWGLMGLWHGAAWHFVVWGLFHGALLILYQMVAKPILDPVWKENFVTHALSVAVTFLLVNIGFLIFRIDSVAKLAGCWNLAAWQATVMDANVIMIVFAIFIFYCLPLFTHLYWRWYSEKTGWDINETYGVRVLYYVATLLLIMIFTGTKNEFIYFQF